MNSVKVGNVDFSVEFVNKDAGIRVVDEGRAIGSQSRQDGRIRVELMGNRRFMGQVLIHEIVHAIVGGYKVKALKNEDDVHDEDSIDQLATGLDEALTSIGIYIEDLFEGSHGE